MVQDSLSHKRVLRMQALCTWIFVCSDSLLLVHTRFTSLAISAVAAQVWLPPQILSRAPILSFRYKLF